MTEMKKKTTEKKIQIISFPRSPKYSQVADNVYQMHVFTYTGINQGMQICALHVF